MTIQVHNAVKRFTASGGGSLLAHAGESFLIRQVFCKPTTNDDYLTLRTQRSTVGFIRVKGYSGNHAPYPGTSTGDAHAQRSVSLLDLLTERGIFTGWPVGEGETFNVSRFAEALGDVLLVYDIGEAGDFTPDMPNGSKSLTFLAFQYLTNLAAITTGADTLLDVGLSPDEWPDFPINAAPVPANHIARLHGFAGCPCAAGNAAVNNGLTTFIKVIRGKEHLWDEDRGGLPFLGDVAVVTDAPGYDPVASVIGPLTQEEQAVPFLLPEPLVCPAGTELRILVTVGGAGADGIDASEIDMMAIVGFERLP